MTSSINDALFSAARLSSLHSLDKGRLYAWQSDDSLSGNAERVYSFTVGERPVRISNVDFQFTGTERTSIELYSGGATSGGSIINPVSMNDYQPNASPYLDNEINEGVSIDTPGSLLARIVFINPDKDVAAISEQDDGGLILAPNRHYYIIVDNETSDPEDYVLSVQAGMG